MKLMCTLSIIKISILVYVVFNNFSADFQRKKKHPPNILFLYNFNSAGTVEEKAKV